MRAILSLKEFYEVLKQDRAFAFNGIVLATREDPQYSYFTKYWGELNQSTGDNCRLFLLVDKKKRERNENAIYMLTSMPLDIGSAGAYDIIKELELNRRYMPCIAFFNGSPQKDQSLYIMKLPSLEQLRSFLRETFDYIDEIAQVSPEYRLEKLNDHFKGKTLSKILRASIADVLEKVLGQRTAELINYKP